MHDYVTNCVRQVQKGFQEQIQRLVETILSERAFRRQAGLFHGLMIFGFKGLI